MKKIKLRMVFLLSSIIALTLVPVVVNAKPSSKKVNNAYLSYCKKNRIDKYTLVDIDKNGIKELLGYSYDKGITIVCTYNANKKKVQKLRSISLGKCQPVIYYRTSKGGFSLATASTGGSTYYLYKLKGTKARLSKTISYTNAKHSSTGFPIYEINGKSVSEAKYNNTIKNLQKLYTEVRFNQSDNVTTTYSSIVKEFNSRFGGDRVRYALVDLNSDGEDELLLSYGTNNADWSNSVYTYYNNVPVLAGTFPYVLAFYYNDGGNGILSCYGHMGHEIIQQIILDNSGNLSVNVISDIQDVGQRDYYSNGNPVELKPGSLF